jgi:hypothetical protein
MMPDWVTAWNIPAVASLSIGPLVIGDKDFYALLGLLAGIALLTLWVVAENYRHANWPTDRRRDDDASDAPPDEPPPGEAATTGPVPARGEWLLDDNTLVRMRAVRREPIRRPDSRPSEQEGDDPASQR